MFYIYRITNLISGKTYIGQHKFSLDKNDGYMGSGRLIKQAFKKYGEENFKKEILEVALSKFEVNILEKYYIAKERTKGKAEYNIANGGEGPMCGKLHSPEVCTKMSKAAIGKYCGKNNPMYGRRGKDNPNFGKHHSPETCKKISEAMSGKNSPSYLHFTEEMNQDLLILSVTAFCKKYKVSVNTYYRHKKERGI